MSLCGDGRLARSSGAKLHPLCRTTNLAKFLHLQVLMWPDLLENYTTSRPPWGPGDGWLSRLRMGFFGLAQRFAAAFQETHSDGFSC
jgi:hypothetical protein